MASRETDDRSARRALPDEVRRMEGLCIYGAMVTSSVSFVRRVLPS